MIPLLPLGLLLGICLTAAICDVRTGRIPNWLTYPGIGLGLIFGWATGVGGWVSPILGMATAGGLFFVFWLSRGVGAGDVKLMAAVGAWVGWPAIIDVVFFTALTGGVMGILYIIWRRPPAVPAGGERGTAQPAKRRMPYAVAIAVGTLVSIVAAMVG